MEKSTILQLRFVIHIHKLMHKSILYKRSELSLDCTNVIFFSSHKVAWKIVTNYWFFVLYYFLPYKLFEKAETTIVSLLVVQSSGYDRRILGGREGKGNSFNAVKLLISHLFLICFPFCHYLTLSVFYFICLSHMHIQVVFSVLEF